MRPTLAALILALAASAVLAQPQPAAPVVNPPSPQTNIVISLADYLTPGVSTYEAMRRALVACRQQKAAKLVIPTGRYVFDDPRILQPDVGHHVGLFGLSDLEIDGQGSEFVFHHPRVGVVSAHCQRLLIRNLTVDWDINLASPGIVKKESDGRTSIRILDEYPANEGTRFGAVNPYDIQNLKWKKTSFREVYSPQNITMIRPQTFVSPDFHSLADGDEVVVRHYVFEGGAFSINLGSSDVTLENITVYSCPGIGFNIVAGERGYRLSNCRLMQRPGARRLVSATAGGSHFARTKGDIIVENCDFSGQGDDSINLHGDWLRVTNKVDQRTVVIGAIAESLSSAKAFFTLVRAGDELKFTDPQNLAERGRFKVVQSTYDQNTDTYTVTVDRDLVSSISAGDLVGDLDQSSPRFVVRNNYFHDHRARGMLIQSQNGLVENNRVKDVTFAGMHLTTDARVFFEGFGIENLIVRGNTIEGCNYATPEIGPQGRHMAALNLIADVPSGLSNAPVHKNVLIEGNTIVDTPGLAILIASSDGVTLRDNTVIRSNQMPFNTLRTGQSIDAQARGSIMVTRASNVTITGNRQLISAGMFDKGIYVDARNTSNVTVQGNTEELPPSSVQLGGPALQVSEGAGRASITVTRSGDTSFAATVDYRTADADTFTVGCADSAGAQGAAYARCDFATSVGTISFAPGETSKTVTVPLIDDGHAEGPETFRLQLSNASGAALGELSATTVTIQDNDAGGAANPVVASVPFFVRQQYLDFLSREPDEGGFNAWSGVLNGCPNIHTGPEASSGCDRIFVSGDGFFRSVEFQLKGAYVFRFYKLAFGRLPEYQEIVSDMSFVAGQTAAEVFARRAELATRFTQRQEFQDAYGAMSDQQYVAALLGRYSLQQVTTPDPASPDTGAKVVLTQADLVARLGAGTLSRAQVLRAVADSDQVSQREFDNAFVAMQYYGYLRRKPEADGYEAWLRVLRGGDTRAMVNGFLNSAEYKLRFGQP